MIRIPNTRHKFPFTYSKTTEIGHGNTLTVNYKDEGWLNGGAELCKHSDKEEYDNSYYQARGTDFIYICHICQSFWHVDMSD